MLIEISEEVTRDYPDLHMAYLEIADMKIGTNSNQISGMIEKVAAEIRESLDLDRVKDQPDFRLYRDFFWRIGVDPTKTRPAAEALVRRILKRSSIPRINDFVDSYNIASIETGVPIGAFDLDALEDRLILRYSRAQEEFLGIGMTEPKMLRDNQLVLSSGEDIIAIYPYRDSDATKILPETSNALIIGCGVPSIARDKLMGAAVKSRDNIKSTCGGNFTKIMYV